MTQQTTYFTNIYKKKKEKRIMRHIDNKQQNGKHIVKDE